MRLAVLGCGMLGETLVRGWLAARVLAPGDLLVTAKRPERAREVAERHGVQAAADNAVAAASAEVCVLCVKPQVAESVVPPIAGELAGKLLVSTCAGLRLGRLAGWAPQARLVRAMPNTPVRIGEGMTVLAPGPGSTPADLDRVGELFAAVGRCRILEEKHLDAVTGLSASGPAFVYVMLEALADGGVMMGLPREAAFELAAQTMQGAARMVLAGQGHPAALKDAVTTPAGCTIAGLLTMEDGKIRSTIARAIQEATRVASSLG
jgi:pyrroline-5-carboxylate reductase